LKQNQHQRMMDGLEKFKQEVNYTSIHCWML